MAACVLARSSSCCSQITARINKLCYGLDLDYVDPIEYVIHRPISLLLLMVWRRVTQKVIAGVYQGVTTVELDVRIASLPSFLSLILHYRTSPRRPPRTLPPSTQITPCSPHVLLSPTYTRRLRRTFRSLSKICIIMVRVPLFFSFLFGGAES